ncbi:MAG: exodeoxyribonuclease III [Betaproteobacteria bacterium]|nr:exodeoxyribonuclease III [Betaproteobacteria bacterium]
MKLVTWNVNSLNVRLPHVLDWLKTHQPDALCLQELKMEDAKFPVSAFDEIGYNTVFDGQKTYNGVAIVSRARPEDVSRGMPGYEDPQKRVIAATIEGVRVVCVYIPNGQSVDSEKYTYKLGWLKALHEFMAAEIRTYGDVALLGDYNIAPDDRDVYDPKAWAGQVLCSEPERAAFQRLLDLGLQDSFRLFPQPESSFTWWDYRMNGFKRNLGLRIDHILVTANLASACQEVTIDLEPRRLERPSDHAPVVATLR